MYTRCQPTRLIATLVWTACCACGAHGNDLADISAPQAAAAMPLQTAAYSVYGDVLNAPFDDWSFGMHNCAATSPVHTGTNAIELDPSGFGGLKLHALQPLSGTAYAALDLWVNGGTAANQNVTVQVKTSNGVGNSVPLGKYVTLVSNTWVHATLPMADMGASSGSIVDIVIQGTGAINQAPMYFDDIALLPAAQPPLSIFSNQLDNHFSDGGWGTYSLTVTTPTHSGNVAVSLTPTNWDGVQFAITPAIVLSTSGYTGISFWINGGKSGGQKLWVGMTVPGNTNTFRVPITNYLPQGIPANAWAAVTVPFADLKTTQLSLGSVYIMDAVGTAQATVYLDDLALVSGTTGSSGGGTPTGGGNSTGSGSAGGSGGSGGAGGWMYTKGNRIYRSDGTLFHGRGANIADPRGCGACTTANLASSTNEVIRRIDTLVDSWHANFLRLDLESYASGATGVLDDAAYLAALQVIVAHVQTKPGVVMEISVWVDPSLDANGWPTDTTDKIWAQLATTFANVPQVMFGIANEPQSNYDGAEDAQVWDRMNTAAASIRAAEAAFGSNKHIILAQGTGGWARFLSYYETHPLTAGDGSNFAYEVHVYDSASTFQSRFLGPAQVIPVVIGEFGPVSGTMTTADTAALMTQAEAAGVPYMAWTFHMRCPPSLLVDNSAGSCGLGMTLAPSAWGQQLQAQLANAW